MGLLKSSFDLLLMLAGEQGGIADEEGGVGCGEHGEWVGVVLGEGGVGIVEALEEETGVGGGAARGGVGGDGLDVPEGFGGGKVAGIFDEQEDAADLVEGGDGAAGNDGELGCELGDGDEAEVGGAGVQLAGAVGGRGVVDVVVRAELGRGSVLEAVEERRGVQEGDGGDSEGHGLIVAARGYVGWGWLR